MKKRAVIFVLLFSLAFASSIFADDPKGDKNFSIGLLGGYTVLPMLVYKVNWKSWENGDEDISVSDDSFLNTAPIGGVSFSYYPSQRFITVGFTLEAFYLKHLGTLKGSYGNDRQNRENYNYHMALDFYEINMLCSIYFTEKAFKPYLQFGLGAVRGDAEFADYHQTVYGATGIIAWGGQYSFTEWFALGGQIRTQDIFGLTYFYEPRPENLMTIKGQMIPLSFLLHTNFYF